MFSVTMKGFFLFKDLDIVNLKRSKPGNKSKKKFHLHKLCFYEYYVHKSNRSIK